MSFQNLVKYNNMLDSLRCNNCRSYHVCQPMYQRDLVHIPLDQECIHNTNQNWFLLPSHDQFPPHPIRSQPEILIHAQHELIVTTTCLLTHMAAVMTSKVEWVRWLPTRCGISSTLLKRQGKKDGIAQNHVRQMIYTLLNELFHTHLISLISKGLLCWWHEAYSACSLQILMVHAARSGSTMSLAILILQAVLLLL